MSDQPITGIHLLDSRDPRAEPLLACYEAARMALVADYAATEGMTTAYTASEAGVTLHVEGTSDQIRALLDRLYTLGLVGFVIEVSSDTDVEALRAHPAVGLVPRADA